MQIVYIDTYGKVVTEPKDIAYKVTLSGSYSYSRRFKEYRHGVKGIEPYLPLSVLTHEKLLVTS
jgi:hypothetical protein